MFQSHLNSFNRILFNLTLTMYSNVIFFSSQVRYSGFRTSCLCYYFDGTLSRYPVQVYFASLNSDPSTCKCYFFRFPASSTWVDHDMQYIAALLTIALWIPGPVSIFEKTSYRKISWSLEGAWFVFRIVRSLWNLTGTSAALPPMFLSNFKAIRQFKVQISWLRDFTRSYNKT